MPRGRDLLVCAAVLCAISVGCRKPKPPVRAQGVVVDAVTGAPLAKIDLRCEISGGHGERSTTTSGADGHFVVRGKLGIEAPFELVATSAHTMEAVATTPRLPFPGEVTMEVLSSEIPSGFSVPTAKGLVLGARVTARVLLPPADRPSAPLRQRWKLSEVTDAIPKLKLRADGSARVVIAPPPEKCDCRIEAVTAPDADQQQESLPESAVKLTTWMPKQLYKTTLVQVLELPKDALRPGRYVFWPNQAPPYDALAATPEVYRTGYLFEVE